MTTTNGAPDKPRPTAPADFWAVPWPQTFVQPVLEGGPADGRQLEPRPRHELPVIIAVPDPLILDGARPVAARVVWNVQVEGWCAPAFPVTVYRLGAYRDAFTAVYR